MRSGTRFYDLLTWALTLGRESAMRERIVRLARVAPGESVLDVGCGTGTLALAAKRAAGARGTVRGLDASVEMVARARAKAARAGAGVTFGVASADALTVPDASVDVVLGTLMMHHLAAETRRHFASEIRRVLRPGGRALIVDFEPPVGRRASLVTRIHRRGHVSPRETAGYLTEAGLAIAEAGAVGMSDLQYVLATAPR